MKYDKDFCVCSAAKPQPQPSGLFSDSDGDMLDGLGLDAGAPPKKVESVPKSKPGRL